MGRAIGCATVLAQSHWLPTQDTDCEVGRPKNLGRSGQSLA
nr:MAG TPA: hypothetical protein [Caudoviricetes sp.]